jgi:acetate kinase
MMPDESGHIGQPVLILNAGSSSLKFAVFAPAGDGPAPTVLLRGQFSGIGGTPAFTAQKGHGELLATDGFGAAEISTHAKALSRLFDWLEGHNLPLRGMLGAGHRIVHGGHDYTSPVRIDPAVLAALEALSPLAPQHMPHNLSAVKHLRDLAPALPQVACFDTAFHATQPEIETCLPIPAEYREKGIRRYGFHGLNYEHVIHVLSRPGGLGVPARLLVLHLGNGASICAVRDGKSIATTMGFSTLDGLIMGTRCGALDPGVLIHLMREEKCSTEGLEDILYNKSGLFGLSGTSGDMRDLLAADTAVAKFAIEKYCHAAARHGAALIPDLGGLDGIVFTGGIGENAGEIRARILKRLDWLGVRYDSNANANNRPDIASADSRVGILIIPANEESVIARHTFALLGNG